MTQRIVNFVGSFAFLGIISVMRWAIVRREVSKMSEQVNLGLVNDKVASERLAVTKRNFTIVQIAIAAAGMASVITNNSPLWVAVGSVLGAVGATLILK